MSASFIHIDNNKKEWKTTCMSSLGCYDKVRRQAQSSEEEDDQVSNTRRSRQWDKRIEVRMESYSKSREYNVMKDRSLYTGTVNTLGQVWGRCEQYKKQEGKAIRGLLTKKPN
jgi:hypothetical protein